MWTLTVVASLLQQRRQPAGSVPNFGEHLRWLDFFATTVQRAGQEKTPVKPWKA